MNKHNLICRECLAVFQFTARERAFYAQNQWDAPIRCPTCRKANKMRKQGKFYGIESTMRCSYPIKKRTHPKTEQYPPHVVGGFR